MEGSADDAAESYSDANQHWRALDNAREIGDREFDLAMLLGPHDVDSFGANEAREAIKRFGAGWSVQSIDHPDGAVTNQI